MFGFLKKKKNDKTKETKENPLTEERMSELRNILVEKEKEIQALDSEENQKVEVLAFLYEEMGLAYAELEENDLAIETLEKSLSLKLTIGDGYKKLMILYNKKRAEAAKNGDDIGIEKYMQKMDDMRQIAKKVTISG